MSIKTLDEANLILGQAVSIQTKHDETLFKMLSQRTIYELGMALSEAPGEVLKLKIEMDSVHRDLGKFRDRIVKYLGLRDFSEFRRLVERARSEFTIVGEFQERVDVQEFYLKVYAASNLPPQDLDKEFAPEEEYNKLANIRKQYETAVALVLETVSKLEIPEASNLILPDSKLTI